MSGSCSPLSSPVGVFQSTGSIQSIINMAANSEHPGPIPLLACVERGQSGGVETLLAGIIAPSIWE